LNGNAPLSSNPNVKQGVRRYICNLSHTDIVIVSYGWISPGRLAIRHDSQRHSPYILPLKAEDISSFTSPPLLTPQIVYNQPYKGYQTTKNYTGLTPGKPRKRAGVKQRLKDEARLSSSAPNPLVHSLFDGVKWKARGELYNLL
jgi:hypothetical protein